LQTLRGMAGQGFSVVFISHKLDEVLEVADRISVLRRGRIAATTTPAETNRRTLARLMVGRELAELVEHPSDEPHQAVMPGEAVLELRSISACPRCGMSIWRSARAKRSASPASPAMDSASSPRS
jgi:simple sugar transport system ATP-binding protein